MSPAAATALRTELLSITSHSGEIHAENMEAVHKLMSNHERVVKDITNPGPKNIDGKQLTQTDLERVDSVHRETVDAMIKEVCERLQGKPANAKPSPVSAAAARYLSKRIQ